MYAIRSYYDGFKESKTPTRKTIGIPRGLMLYYQQFPFWRNFWENLGFDVVISDESNKTLLNNAIEMMTAETCLPVELMHGHVDDLLKKNVDHIFLPFVVDNKVTDGSKTSNANCPWVQTNPFMIKASLHKDRNQTRNNFV